MSQPTKSRQSAILLPAALILAAVAGCGSPTPPSGPTLEEQVYGTWDWVSAEGGIAGTVRTPATEGFTLNLTISRPSRVELQRNGTTEVATTFEFVPQQDLGDLSVMARLRYADRLLSREEHEVVLDNGQLVLIDPCCDGFIYRWRVVP